MGRSGGGGGRSSGGGGGRSSSGGSGRSSSGGFSSSSSRSSSSRSSGSGSRSSMPSSSGNSHNKSNDSLSRALKTGIGLSVGSQIGRRLMGGRRRSGYSTRGSYGGGYNRRRRGFGISHVLAIVTLIVIAASVINSSSRSQGANAGNIPQSTVSRAALTGAAVASGDILTYEDATRDGDWFFNTRAMQNGAESAHRLTGVKFGIYVADEINGNSRPGSSELNEFADGLYEDWFANSGGHLLVVLVDSGNGDFAAMDIIGSSARTVFDNEAMNIFYGYLDSYWQQPEAYDESEMFGLALSNTAERIMTVTPTTAQVIVPWIFVVVIVIVVFIGVIVALNANAKRKRAAAEQSRADAALLATPIAGLDGAPPRDPLLDRYRNP
ncbi:MAG: hypothetical protein FWG90_13630 [Oscillospiraceae bacterium]|nr:hypothetical protein [Oscillospiraceae bacterium]